MDSAIPGPGPNPNPNPNPNLNHLANKLQQTTSTLFGLTNNSTTDYKC